MRHNATTFRAAVEAVEEIREGYQPGLQALAATVRKTVDVNNTRAIKGSVDLDATLRERYPQEPRWDYVVSIGKEPKHGRLVWIEYHDANGTTADEVVKKARWLKSWVKAHGRPLLDYGGTRMDMRWIASGRVGFRPGSRQARLLAQEQVRFPVSRLKLEV